MNARTCFDILCISRDATLDEAKDAYKRLVKLWHPDQYGNFPEKQVIAQEKLKEINVAYRDIVAILKHNPVQTETSSGEKNTQRQHEENPRDKKKEGATFWDRVSQFVNTNILKSNRSENLKNDIPLSPGATQRQGVTFARRGGGIAPDFQQILNNTVRGKQLRGGARQRHGNMKRVRRRFGNPASYRVETTAKRSPGDRVEKITPVGRVNRIGGD